MKVRFVQSLTTTGGTFNAGTEADVSDAQAQALIAGGVAAEVGADGPVLNLPAATVLADTVSRGLVDTTPKRVLPTSVPAATILPAAIVETPATVPQLVSTPVTRSPAPTPETVAIQTDPRSPGGETPPAAAPAAAPAVAVKGDKAKGPKADDKK